MARLSVNVNKIATLRNSRGGAEPSLMTFVKRIVGWGAEGITVHPRADRRHITPEDARQVASGVSPVETNFEGDVREEFLDLVLECKPTQCTLVPVSPGELTSNHGWDVARWSFLLAPVITRLRSEGVRVSLFLDPGDEALSSDLMWENYNLSWETRIGAHISCYPFFREGLAGFNLEGFKAALEARRGRKLVVSLNFPNNPSGYTPTRAEAEAITGVLTRAAEAGQKLVVVCDDAYYGMFYDDACTRESLFGRLAQDGC